MKDLKTKRELNELKLDLVQQIFNNTKKINYLLEDYELEILDDINHYQYTDLKDWFDCFNKLNKLMEKRLNELSEMDLEEIEEIEDIE